MRFAANVFPDDILTCGGEVLAVAPMEAGGGIVTAVWHRSKGETTKRRGEGSYSSGD